MRTQRQPIFAALYGALLAAVLTNPAAAAATGNPFALAQATQPQAAEVEIPVRSKDVLQESTRAKKCGYKMPAERADVPNTEQIRSGFCGAGKCGGGDAAKQVAPR